MSLGVLLNPSFSRPFKETYIFFLIYLPLSKRVWDSVCARGRTKSRLLIVAAKAAIFFAPSLLSSEPIQRWALFLSKSAVAVVSRVLPQ